VAEAASEEGAAAAETVATSIQFEHPESPDVTSRPPRAQDSPVKSDISLPVLTPVGESEKLPPLMGYSLERYGNEALAENGDVGPEGKHLFKTWMSPDKDDRTMLVAESDENVIVGCIGVKIGKDMEKEEPGSTVASIWRMSVEESARRQGVGLSLIHAAERWARGHQCTTMVLETANKIAGQFYTKKAGYCEEPFPKERSLFLHYAGIVKMYTKSFETAEER
jgi:GNAT superfamily N-acetyltransferase